MKQMSFERFHLKYSEFVRLKIVFGFFQVDSVKTKNHIKRLCFTAHVECLR